MGKFIDLTGQRFDHLVAIRRVGKIHTSALWECQCDCGKIVQRSSNLLRRGIIHSCGCTQYDWLSVNKIAQTHGKTHERLYRVWLGMRERCSNPHHNRWNLYGGRGIKVCDAWKDYLTFREWALVNGYDENAPRGECTIDRIDSDGDYAPENCRWVTMKTQNNNRHQRGYMNSGNYHR